MKVSHLRCDLHTSFEVKRSKVRVTKTINADHIVRHIRVGHSWSWVTFSKPNPTHKSLHPTQPIIDTWYDVLGYTENFIQQLLHVTDKFTVNESYYSAAVLINRQ